MNGWPLQAGAGWLRSPSVISSLPSGVNFVIVWVPSSAQYTESSGPIKMPWVRWLKTPSPNEKTNVPSASNTMTGWAVLRVIA